MAELILFNKPFQVMCQFTDSEGRSTLADFISTPGVYPAGRLDYDSEGLLLLTADGALQHRIAHPSQKLPKTYWVQVEGIPGAEAIAALNKGVALSDGMTRPAKVRPMAAPELWPRKPPVRHRESVPDSWLEITISEGRNRQVRRMTAAVGHPTLRLVRASIGHWTLGNLLPGQFKQLSVHLPQQAPKVGKNRNRRNNRQ